MTSPSSPDRPAEGEPPQHPDDAAELRERADGAHAEQISDEANFRADESPPGEEPEEPAS